jgi:hypothetical protein
MKSIKLDVLNKGKQHIMEEGASLASAEERISTSIIDSE